MSDKTSLIHRCRLARDFLFSAKNERPATSFLVTGPGVEEAEAVLVWEGVSKKLQDRSYSSYVEFMQDVEPIKKMLLHGHPKPSKKRAKHIELVFLRIHEMSSHISHDTYFSNPCDQIIDLLTPDNVEDVMNAFHSNGQTYGLQQEEKARRAAAHTKGNATIA
jgi:hypothetical protein